MHFPLAVALLLCSSTVLRADAGPPAPDDSLFRTNGDEHFEVTVKGVTGAHIDVRAVVSVGRHYSVGATTSEGTAVLVDILIQDGEKGKKRIEMRLVECPPNKPARVVRVSDLLAPGESNITGLGWNSLFEIRLTQK